VGYLTILRVKRSKIKIKNTLRIYSKSALISVKFRDKIMWVVAILRIQNIKIKNKNTWRTYIK
jgi:hypothetical protein